MCRLPNTRETITETDLKGKVTIIYLNNDQIKLLIWWVIDSKIKIDVVNTFWKSVISQVNDRSHFTRDPVLNSIYFQTANSLFFDKYIDLDNHAAVVSTFTFDKSFAVMNSNMFSFFLHSFLKIYLPEQQEHFIAPTASDLRQPC